MRRFEFEGATALVTGAAGGIGAQLARGLATRGSHLILLDRNADGLAALADDLAVDHDAVRVETHTIDLTDRAALLDLAASIATAHPDLSLLVNNAGVALAGTFENLGLGQFEWVMEVNFHAPVALTHALLPTLLANPGSHIVNMSSLFGLIGPYGQSAYSSSKYAMRGFSEVLRTELAPRQVGVTVVHPGGVRTDIARSAQVAERADEEQSARLLGAFDRMLRYPPERAAREILSGVHRRSARVLVTPEAVFSDLAVRVAPSRYPGLIDLMTKAAARAGQLPGLR